MDYYQQKILQHLQKHKSISVIYARMYYGCLTVSHEIENLRYQGHNIKTHTETHDFNGRVYEVYTLEV